MKKQIQKRAALFAAAFLFGAAALAAPQTAALADETEEAADEASSTEEAIGNVKATPVLIVEGNTIYVDASSDGGWNSMQGTIEFDPSLEVEDYGTEEDFVLAMNDAGLTGFPICNVTDEGEFIFAGAYTSATGAGAEYDGHIFYITFKDTSTPIDITVYDEYNYELFTATVDGAAEAVTYAPDAAVVAENEEKHEEEAAAYAAGTSTGTDTDADTDTDTSAESSTEEAAETSTSSRNVVPIIVVIVVVVLAAVTIVIARKNKTSGQAAQQAEDVQTPDEAAQQAEDVQTPDEAVQQAEDVQTPDEAVQQPEDVQMPDEKTQALGEETPNDIPNADK